MQGVDKTASWYRAKQSNPRKKAKTNGNETISLRKKLSHHCPFKDITYYRIAALEIQKSASTCAACKSYNLNFENFLKTLLFCCHFGALWMLCLILCMHRVMAQS